MVSYLINSRQVVDEPNVCQDLDVSQVDIDTSIGYALKRTTSALRAALDECLRDLELTVSQYSSLELISSRPGLSNADLARGVFVSRQATHQLLGGLRRRNLIEVIGEGREQKLLLTAVGASRLEEASAAVASIEEQMLGGLDRSRRKLLLDSLNACASALTTPPEAD